MPSDTDRSGLLLAMVLHALDAPRDASTGQPRDGKKLEEDLSHIASLLEDADEEESRKFAGDELTRKASFFETCERDEKGHCKPGAGGDSASPGKSPTRVAREKVAGKIAAEIMGGKHASADELVVSLMALTAPQIHEIKTALGLAASGTKAELARKVTERALGKKVTQASLAAPTVESLTADIAALKASSSASPADYKAVLTRLGQLSAQDRLALAKHLHVEASGAKREQSRQILEKAIAKPSRQPVQDPFAANLPPVKNRLAQIQEREAGGAAPFADLLYERLLADKALPENVSAPTLFTDMRRQAEGLAPLNTRVTQEQLESALRKIAPDAGRLTATEFMALVPALQYPTTGTEGVGDKDAALRARRIPADALARSGLGLLQRPTPDPSQPGTFDVPQVQKLPPLVERLDRIHKHEASGRAPFADALITALRDTHAVSGQVHPAAVVKDLQRLARGEAPLNSNVSREQLSQALRLIGPDFGRLTASEFLRVAPHLSYPEQTQQGVAGREVIAQRHLPADLQSRLKNKNRTGGEE